MSEKRLQRHHRLLQDVKPNSQPLSDFQLLREGHRFLRDDDDVKKKQAEESEGTVPTGSSSTRIAERYYSRLFREFVLGDLSQYKKNVFGFRWRTGDEVRSGKGQFVCGNKNCDRRESERDVRLRSYQVHFVYNEEEKEKEALVKIRLCEECSAKLKWTHLQKERRKKLREKKKTTKNREEN